MRNSTMLLLFCLACLSVSAAGKGTRQYYQIRIFHLKAGQEARTDSFLQRAYLPALHRAGIAQVGVFKPIDQDTADLRIYVLVPFRTLEQFSNLPAILERDKQYQSAGAGFLDAAYNQSAYNRIESILLLAFEKRPQLTLPALSAPKAERVYELRSYESPTEQYHVNKVKMFNDGNEVGIFDKLAFNPVFYGSVLAGSKMPNLMYLTTFNSRADRDAHWKAFSANPDWKQLQGMQEYSHNVSHSDILFLRPVEYSDI
ncbi:NIPSNAP family protein [Chitinophaga vietnamensis]|uniref:NIPSNAP family protein n=1 Tax=Chitinophaga vietnamensis TaxID=2593957 RepID=UPI0011777CDB|nr:NIPSNAP family protein [Chitinophaga vietnamensis]